MSAIPLLRAAADGRRGGGHGGRGSAASALQDRQRPEAAVGVALWVFIGVATTLFTLFIAAYVMRMDGNDWSSIALPRQLWLSTALLVVGSAALQRAVASARADDARRTRGFLAAGAASALAFLAVQLWAWQALLAAAVAPINNPAASFFYLLTAMHGLHVIGGIAAWAWITGTAAQEREAAPPAWRIALCARYWHFLLALWLLLYATFAGLTPDVVRYLCGTG